MAYKLLKIALVLIVVIVILVGFSSSYSSHNIDNIVQVVAIGIDKDSNSENNIKVSFQFVNTSGLGESSSSEQSGTFVTSINAYTINQAISLMNSYIGKELNFSHCKVIVFSEEFARDGIANEICTFINNEEIRPSTNIVITTSEANTYLKDSNPNIEKIITKYYDTFELTSSFTGYSDDANLGEFYTKMISTTSDNTAIWGRTFESSSSSEAQTDSNSSSEQENSDTGEGQSENGSDSSSDSSPDNSEGGSPNISGKRETLNVGIAVFNGDKYVGTLSDLDSICHLIVTNNLHSSTISIPTDNFSQHFLDLSISPSKNSKISVDTSSDIPNISVFVFCDAKILTIDSSYDYESPEVLEQFSSIAEDFLKEQIETYLKKTSEEFKSDIACFGNYALQNFLTINDWENYKWLDKYENATFNVNVDLNVSSSYIFSGHR